MKYKGRRFLALAGAALLLAGLMCPVAAADETGTVSTYNGEPEPYTEDPTYSEPTTGGEDPAPQEPVSQPEPPVVSDPQSDPGVTGDTSSEPSDYTGGESDTYEDPTSESDTDAGYVEATPTPAPTAPPVNGPVTLEQPTLDRPKVVLGTNSTSTADEADTGPNYVTFARLNQRSNSMAITLFYGGCGLILLGALGLITLFIFFIRGRRKDERDGIIEEIEQAEHRHSPYTQEQARPLSPTSGAQRPQQVQRPLPPPSASQPSSPAQRPVRRPQSGTAPIMPVEASPYTEEFTLPDIPKPVARPSQPAQPARPQQARPTQPAQSAMPQQARPTQPAQSAMPQQARPVQPAQSAMPQQARPTQPAQSAMPQQARPTQPAQPAAAPTAPASKPVSKYDTEEILREALRDMEKNK